MGIIEAVIYGIIQGIAEFLPISSSGHLALAQNFSEKLQLGAVNTEASDNFAFNIALHLATLVSVCVVFRKDVLVLIKSFFSLAKKLFTGKLKQGLDNGEKLFLMLCIATLPLIPVKLLGLDETVESISSISWLIGILLIINGCMLVVSDRLSGGKAMPESGGFLRPLGVGLVQAIMGILPGISRSGSTITGGRVVGYNREEAVRFSFLMSIPAILGALVLELLDFSPEMISTSDVVNYLSGTLVSGIVGYICIKTMLVVVRGKKFKYFAYFCFAMGAFAVLFSILA